jgi:intein-encoded DNA endonuclease-like protein
LKYKEKTDSVPCENCGKIRKFRYIKHSGQYKNYRPLCATCVGRSRIHKTHNYFDIIDCEEKAYSFGFFWADGCINRYKTFTVRLHEQDCHILDFFKNYFGGQRFRRKFKRADGRIYYQEEWVIHDMVWIDFLKKINFRKNLNSIPNHLFHHFLRGLIDGDGHYSYRNNEKISHISISSTINDEYDWLTPYISIPYRYQKVISKTGKSSSLTFTGGMKILNNFIKYLYTDSTISLIRKLEKNLKIINS